MRPTPRRRARTLVTAGLTVTAATVAVGLAGPLPSAVAAPSATTSTLGPGSSLVSPAGGFRLTMQTDGNLVLYTDNGYPMWSSGTWGRGPSTLVVQGDGNLVVYAAGGRATWNSGTVGSGARQLVVQDDGNLVAYSPTRPVWWTGGLGFTRPAAGASQISAGGGLMAGDSIRSGTGLLAMQADGNLVAYGANGPTWSSGTSGGGLRAILQGDGNVVVYGGDGRARWNSGTYGSGAVTLRVAPDGTLSLTTGSGAQVWTVGAASQSASIAADVLALLNRQRAMNGLGPLAVDARLNASAAAHNRAMAAANTMSHQLPGEPDLGTRISATGYAWSTVAENIGWTSDLSSAGAQQLQTMMYNEVPPNDGHRRNILSTAVSQIGVDVLLDGRGKLWLTTDFGQPR